MADQVRVALLARAGQARDQLHKALEEAGAQIVAEGDPGELDPKDVSEKLPKVFLVSLEPAIEKSLERFDSLLERDGIEVMYDDAEVTSKLDGWDLNRWARHLAGKLLGHENLPPVPAGAPAIGEAVDTANDAGMLLQPGLPPTPAELMAGAKLEDYTSDSSELADWVPTSPSLAPKVEAEDAAADSFSWDGSQAGEDGKEFKLDTDLGIDIDLASLDFAPAPDPVPAETATSIEDEPIFRDMPSEGVRFSSFEEDAAAGEQLGDLDADVAALAAQLEAFEKSDTRAVAVEPEFARAAPKEGKDGADGKVDEAPKVVSRAAAKAAEKSAPAAAATSARAGEVENFDFSNLSLAPVDGEAALASAPPIAPKFTAPPEPPPAVMKSSFGELSIQDDSDAAPVAAKPMPADGAVLILAGLGGPDAVRQLLSTLPDTLAVPVLLYQHLEVGKHERLVEQLAKISKLPVQLAREKDTPEAGKVTLLPAGMTAVADGAGLRFATGSLSQLITALSPADSMVIVLSGADVQLVPMILTVKEEGGIVLAQDPEVCFDAVAATAMRKEGAQVYPALGLARQVAARWPA